MRKQPTNDESKGSPHDLGLTGRQVDVLALMMQGKSNKAICRALDMAEQTVKKHVTAILKALHVTNRTEAVIAVGQLGWELPRIGERFGQGEATPTDQSAVQSPRFNTSVAALQPQTRRQSHLSQLPKFASPDRSSIVVLPFTNLSTDPSQEYFADGMVEDITIALGRLPWLFVIGSASAFTYKNHPVDIRQ